MANQKITDLAENTAPPLTKYIEIASAGVSEKMQLKNLPCVGARVRKVTSQSIPHNTLTAVVFDSERFDTDTIHDNATNNTRLTCKTAGIYQITFNGLFAFHATGWRFFGIRLNGTTVLAGSRIQAVTVSAIGTEVTITTLWSMEVNDYVEAIVLQDSTASLNLVADVASSPEFMMVKV